MKPLAEHYDEKGRFHWPADPREAVQVARAILIGEFRAHSSHWTAFGRELVANASTEKRFERPWSAIAKEDKAFREAFQGLDEVQKRKLVELLERCVSGAVFSCLVTLDQFPHGDLEVLVRPTVAGGVVALPVQLAPADEDLHDEFNASHS